MRCADQVEGLLLEAVSVDDIVQDGSGQIYDALVVAFQRLPTAMKALSRVLNAAQSKVADGGVSQTISVAAMQISPPFTKNGSTNVVALFELSDGQTIAIYFHNPETTPKKIQLDDAVVSWKWLLNKLDITIAVAPERGRDLDVRKVAERVMALAVANSKKFQAANVKRAEKLAEITALKDKIASVDAELGKVLEEIKALEIEHGEEAAWSNGIEESTAAEPAAAPPALPTLDISTYAAVVAIAPAPMQVPADWVQMNASAPLQGSETQVINRADLSNRYFAALDPQDELSGEYLALNAKAGACVVFVASEEQVRTMALNTAPVHQLPSLLALSMEEQKIALEPYISRLAGRSYAELAKLAAMPIPEMTPAPEISPASAVIEPQPVEAATTVSDNPAPALPEPATPPVTQAPAPSAELARRVISKADAMKAMTYLKPFMSVRQRNAVKHFMQGEEKQFFYDKMVELADIIRNMPHTYQQQNENQPIYYLHYFKGGADWHIAEKDKLGDGTLQAFGHADLFGDGGELGYINIGELVANGVELDFHFEPQKLAAKEAEEVSTPPTQAGAQGQDNARVVDAQFLRDVASGRIDIWQNDPSARLDAMFASYDESDTEMMTLCGAAATAYTDFMKWMMQKVG